MHNAMHKHRNVPTWYSVIKTISAKYKSIATNIQKYRKFKKEFVIHIKENIYSKLSIIKNKIHKMKIYEHVNHAIHLQNAANE